MYAVENVHLRIFFSLLLLQYLDYMSRKTRTVLSKRIHFVLDSNSKNDRILPWYFMTEVNRVCTSLFQKYKVYWYRGISCLYIYDEVLVPRLARKICRIYSKLTTFLHDLTVVSKAVWQKRITWQIHTIENKSYKIPSIKMRLTLEKYNTMYLDIIQLKEKKIDNLIFALCKTINT